jgi:hypothetical protein
VEYKPLPREWCTSDGCLYEGVLTAEGCRKGVCVRYRVWVYSRDKRRWEAKERWRRRGEEAGGCTKQQVADALWELAGRFEVGVWYEYRRVGVWVDQYDVFCGVVVNGVEWVRKWIILRERLIEIAKVLRKFPWMVEVARQRPMSILHPYAVEVYVAKDGSEACFSLTPPKAYCARDGTVKEVRLELEFKRYEVYEDKIREVYKPRELLAFVAAAREYVKKL